MRSGLWPWAATTSHITYLLDLMRPHRKETGGSRQPSQPALFLLTQFWTVSAPHAGQTQSKRLPIGIPKDLPWLCSYIFWDRSRVLHPPAKYLTPPSNQFFLPQSTTCEHSIPKIKINCHDVQFLDIWGFSSLWGSQYMRWEQPKWQILLSAFLSSLLLYWNVFWGTKTNSPKQTCVTLCCFNGITPTHTKMKFQFAKQLLWNPKQDFTFTLRPADFWSLLLAFGLALLIDAGLFTPAYADNRVFQVEMNPTRNYFFDFPMLFSKAAMVFALLSANQPQVKNCRVGLIKANYN